MIVDRVVEVESLSGKLEESNISRNFIESEVVEGVKETGP